MEHLYRINIKAIRDLSFKLNYLMDTHGHEFWLHIDNEKLDKCNELLDGMVTAINDEIDHPFSYDDETEIQSDY